MVQWDLQTWKLKPECSVPEETRLRCIGSFPKSPQNNKAIRTYHCTKKGIKSGKTSPGISHLKHTQTNRSYEPFIVPSWVEKWGKDDYVAVFKSLNQEHHLVVNQTPHAKTKKKKAVAFSLKETYKVYSAIKASTGYLKKQNYFKFTFKLFTISKKLQGIFFNIRSLLTSNA